MDSLLVDFKFYTDEYHGESVSSQNEFLRLERIAEKTLSSYTGGADVSGVEDIKFCICELVDVEKKHMDAYGKSSESVGGYSVSYDKSQDSKSLSIREVLFRYLGHTNLMYRGIPCVH